MYRIMDIYRVYNLTQFLPLFQHFPRQFLDEDIRGRNPTKKPRKKRIAPIPPIILQEETLNTMKKAIHVSGENLEETNPFKYDSDEDESEVTVITITAGRLINSLHNIKVFKGTKFFCS